MKTGLTMVAILVLISLSGCADKMQIVTEMPLVGFWHGLWHGLIVLFAFIGSLFSDDIAIYAMYNNGGWYDFGYVLGIGGLSGGAVSIK